MFGYQFVMIDPPWPFELYSVKGQAGRRVGKPDYRHLFISRVEANWLPLALFDGHMRRLKAFPSSAWALWPIGLMARTALP